MAADQGSNPTEFGSSDRAVAAYNAAGIPAILTPGTKGPRVPGWPKWQLRTLTKDEQSEIAGDYRSGGGSCGVAILLGALARYAGYDFDRAGIFEQWIALLTESTRRYVLDRLPIVRTPKGHIGHVYVPLDLAALSTDGWFQRWMEERRGNFVPARYVVADEQGIEDAPVAIELRVPGKHVLMAPGSEYGVHDKHPERTWEYAGLNSKRIEELESLEPVSESVFKEMLEAATALDDPRAQAVLIAKRDRQSSLHRAAKRVADLPADARAAIETALKTPEGTPDADRPGDDFNARASWADVLGPADWEEIGKDLWRRPGGTGVTASTKFKALCVFSTNAWPLEQSGDGNHAYSKFRAFAVLYHGGDFSAAAKELRASGYGTPSPKARKAAAANGPAENESEANDESEGASFDGQRPPLTDIGNAERLVRRHGENLRYVPQWGWLRFDGKRWCQDDARHVELLAKETIRAIVVEELQNCRSQQAIDDLYKHARKSEHDARIRAMLARAVPEMPASVSDFDRAPWLLNVENGTIDLRTGVLREHRREDMLTKLAPVIFDPLAHSEDVEHFLNSTTGGDLEFRACIERLLGYGITGFTHEDKLGLLTGPGNTGKTTLLESLRAMLGDYATTVPFECLLAKEHDGGGPRPELARCVGVRILTASEVEEGKRFNAGTIKSLCGGDSILVHAKFKDPFELVPKFKLLLAANLPPRFGHGSGDTAARRRLIVVPFKTAPAKVDVKLRGRLRSPQARAALLAICVRGCLDWQQHGLKSCDVIDAATAEYWGLSAQADELEPFLKLWCIRDSVAVAQVGALYERYQSAQADLGRPAMSANRFSRSLDSLGFEGFQAPGGTRMRRGLRLLSDEGAA